MTDIGRLDSWKEIADYLRRSVRTAQRWEREAALPVRRVSPDGGAVYAFRRDIDAWWQGRRDDGPAPLPVMADEPATAAREARAPRTPGTRVLGFLPHDVRVDPDSAAGHASLAVYFFTLTVMGLLPPDEGVPATRAAASRALHLEADHADALALQGVVLALYDRAWDDAARRFARALRDASPTVQFHYATWFLGPLQRHEESIVHLRAALVYEPLYLLGRVSIGCDLCSLGRVEEGLAELEQVLRVDAQFGPALGHLGREYALGGRVRDAHALAARTYASIPKHPNAVGFRAGMLTRAGDRHGAAQVLQTLAHDAQWSLPRARAEACIVCEEFDAALECMVEAIENRDPGLWLLLAGTAGLRLRERPGWSSVRAALGLTEDRERMQPPAAP